MSFGWSAGDLLETGKIIVRIVSSMRKVSGARQHFQELEAELNGLRRALESIDNLVFSHQNEPEIEALKFVSCSCKDTLQRFEDKLKPFEDSLAVDSTKSRLKASPRMVRWELLVKKDMPELRTYLVAHVGSLNMLLETAALKLVARSRLETTELRRFQEQANMKLVHLLNGSALAIREQVMRIATDDIIPKLDQLMMTANNVKRANDDAIDVLINLSKNPATPSSRFSWAQDPVRFQDGLGRVMPIPSEFSVAQLHAVIRETFRTGPGFHKVQSGEYELFYGSSLWESNFELVDAADEIGEFCRLHPGEDIIMAMVIGQYLGSVLRCPRYGCEGSLGLAAGQSGAQFCSTCYLPFRACRKHLPRPLKAGFSVGAPGHHQNSSTSRKRTRCETQENTADRRFYKNISVLLEELPQISSAHLEQIRKGPRQRKTMRDGVPASVPSIIDKDLYWEVESANTLAYTYDCLQDNSPFYTPSDSLQQDANALMEFPLSSYLPITRGYLSSQVAKLGRMKQGLTSENFQS